MRIAREIGGKEPIQVVGEDAHGKVKIHFNHHGRRDAVKVKEVNLLSDILFDQPSSRIFVNDAR